MVSMLKRCLLIFIFGLTFISAGENVPKYLYKILSVKNWEESQCAKYIALDKADDEFIHLSTEGQLDRIIAKYWKGVPQFVVLTIDPNKLEGELVFEANPGGENKYYHLYNGHIPPAAVVKTVFNKCVR